VTAGINRDASLCVSSVPAENLTPAIENRVVEVLTLLADRGQHRAPPYRI
jgi:hypothetical protein